MRHQFEMCFHTVDSAACVEFFFISYLWLRILWYEIVNLFVKFSLRMWRLQCDVWCSQAARSRWWVGASSALSSAPAALRWSHQPLSTACTTVHRHLSATLPRKPFLAAAFQPTFHLASIPCHIAFRSLPNVLKISWVLTELFKKIPTENIDIFWDPFSQCQNTDNSTWKRIQGGP